MSGKMVFHLFYVRDLIVSPLAGDHDNPAVSELIDKMTSDFQQKTDDQPPQPCSVSAHKTSKLHISAGNCKPPCLEPMHDPGPYPPRLQGGRPKDSLPLARKVHCFPNSGSQLRHFVPMALHLRKPGLSRAYKSGP